MFIAISILGLLGVVYATLDLALLAGLLKLGRSRILRLPQKKNLSISILVCARNEERNIAQSLASLLSQDYAGTFEILVANDRSTDATGAILMELAKANPRLRVLNLDATPQGFTPKKYAITRLVEIAHGEILLLTDADCIAPATWATTMAACYQEGIDWVSGYSYFYTEKNKSSLLHGVDALDFLSHRTIDAASAGLGFPITACGQNVSYRRSLFLELQGFAGVAHVVSGDDDLLMHKLSAKRPSAIRYCTQPASFVYSQSKNTWRGVWEQRKRWASKTTQYNASAVIVLSSIFSFYLLTLFGLIASFAYGILAHQFTWLGIFALAWLWKTLWDGLVMAKGIQLFHEVRLAKWFVPTAILHLPLIVGAVLSGLFGKFTWKDSSTGRVKPS